MKKLHELAKQLKENNFEMTPKIKNQFEEFLSIIAEGSRILHPRFGLGTVKRTQGNIWIVVEFDKDVEEYNYRLNKWEKEQALKESVGEKRTYWNKPSLNTKAVHISSCTSIHMLIKKEMQRDMFSAHATTPAEPWS